MDAETLGWIHANGLCTAVSGRNEQEASLALLGGFALMLALDNAF